MIQRLLANLDATADRWRERWRWLGYALTAAGLVYVAAILVSQGLELRSLAWQAYLPASLVSLGLYLVSLSIQFFVWIRVLSFHRAPDWRDVDIYARMILARRLPGGIWHWVGRAAMYSASTQVPARVVVFGNFLEWAMLALIGTGILLTGVPALGPAVRWLVASLVFGTVIALATAWQPRTRPLGVRLAEAGLWTGLYAFCWALGGAIVWFLIRASGPGALSWAEATRLWSAAGATAMVINILPAAVGVQEVTLTVALQAYLSPSLALVVAVFIRVLFTLADVLSGTLGWGISSLVLRHRRHQAQSRQPEPRPVPSPPPPR